MAYRSIADQQRLVVERMRAAGLPVSDLLADARIGARLLPDSQGRSQLGGRPRMPPGSTWPEWNGRPLQYLARIDLAELAGVLAERDRHGFPATGQLHLWADALGEGWGYDPAHAGSFGATITGSEQPAVEYETPRDVMDEGYAVELELPHQAVRPVPELVLPDCFDEGTRDLLTDSQFDVYWDLREEIDREVFGGAPRHRLFGRPDLVQNPMELDCQLASNGVYVGTPEGYATPAAKRLESGAADWRLLAQIDSDDSLGLMWGDAGLIYWWLRVQDAAAGRVDRCWGILQCS